MYKDTTEVMYSTLIIKCKNKERVAYTGGVFFLYISENCSLQKCTHIHTHTRTLIKDDRYSYNIRLFVSPLYMPHQTYFESRKKMRGKKCVRIESSSSFVLRIFIFIFLLFYTTRTFSQVSFFCVPEHIVGHSLVRVNNIYG